ncbi:MAG: hypothetical protein VX893_10225 [Candidatus Latescibacterota bacterium]|nr:hypothetical protein [Candidatus Latescibacterota bacterium]
MVMGLIESLLGEPTFVHPRHNLPYPLSRPLLTYYLEPHQDIQPVGGTQNTWPVWIPLGDCDSDLSGVALASGSNWRGYLDNARVISGELLDNKTVWHWNPFSSGDMLIFNSLTMRQGRDNTTADRIRLSTSGRYQSIREPVDAAVLTPHWDWADWMELYADWG